MIEIRLNGSIYSQEIIQRAVEAYKGLARIHQRQDGEMTIVAFSKCKYDEKRTTQEFENYLIEIENS